MPEGTSIWGDVDYLAPRLSSSSRISVTRNGDALSILFADGAVNLDAKSYGRDGWWTAAVAIPLRAPEGVTRFIWHLRGFISKTANTRAVLVTSIAGHVETREFGYGTESTGADFTAESVFDLAPLTGGHVVVHVAIQAERQQLEGENVTLALDSADAFSVRPA